MEFLNWILFNCCAFFTSLDSFLLSWIGAVFVLQIVNCCCCNSSDGIDPIVEACRLWNDGVDVNVNVNEET